MSSRSKSAAGPAAELRRGAGRGKTADVGADAPLRPVKSPRFSLLVVVIIGFEGRLFFLIVVVGNDCPFFFPSATAKPRNRGRCGLDGGGAVPLKDSAVVAAIAVAIIFIAFTLGLILLLRARGHPQWVQ